MQTGARRLNAHRIPFLLAAGRTNESEDALMLNLVNLLVLQARSISYLAP